MAYPRSMQLQKSLVVESWGVSYWWKSCISDPSGLLVKVMHQQIIWLFQLPEPLYGSCDALSHTILRQLSWSLAIHQNHWSGLYHVLGRAASDAPCSVTGISTYSVSLIICDTQILARFWYDDTYRSFEYSLTTLPCVLVGRRPRACFLVVMHSYSWQLRI